jgi:hypothetical protein
MRHNFPRSFYLPAGAQLIARVEHLGLEAYMSQRATPRGPAYIGIGFAGQRRQPDWHFRFTTPERLAQHVADWIAGQKRRAEHVAARRAERKRAPRGVSVGDILSSSWGYDQTNVDFYQVTALIGSTMCELRRIGARSVETGMDRGQCMPHPGAFLDPARYPPLKVVVKNGSAKVGHHYATKCGPDSTHYWSSYA